VALGADLRMVLAMGLLLLLLVACVIMVQLWA
jgi:hypothetical protein